MILSFNKLQKAYLGYLKVWTFLRRLITKGKRRNEDTVSPGKTEENPLLSPRHNQVPKKMRMNVLCLHFPKLKRLLTGLLLNHELLQVWNTHKIKTWLPTSEINDFEVLFPPLPTSKSKNSYKKLMVRFQFQRLRVIKKSNRSMTLSPWLMTLF